MPFGIRGNLPVIPVVGTQSAPNNVLSQSFFRRQSTDSVTRYASTDPDATQLGTRAIAQLTGSTAIGADALAVDENSVAVGVSSLAHGAGAIAIGSQAQATLYRGIAVGYIACSKAVNAIVIGAQSLASHPGAIVIGNGLSSTSPNSLRIGNLTIPSGGWLVQDELTTDPTTTDLTSLNQFALYMKNNKFVIAYNNAGTITYISIPMDGATTTWTHNTVAP